MEEINNVKKYVKSIIRKSIIKNVKIYFNLNNYKIRYYIYNYKYVILFGFKIDICDGDKVINLNYQIIPFGRYIPDKKYKDNIYIISWSFKNNKLELIK